MMATMLASRFPIPVSLHDLEREPYNLIPYPEDFDDSDEAARSDSFAGLVQFVEQGNRTLRNASMSNLFPSTEEEDEDPWMEDARVQALYTLVRKSTSLALATRQSLADALATAVSSLCQIVQSASTDDVAPQSFRDAFACHLYMLYSFMFFLESEAKGNPKVTDDILNMRRTCADAMVQAAETAAACRHVFWRRGVPDEAVVVLPCRIAYPMLEACTGVIARRNACGDQAIRMIAVTTQATDSLLSTVTAALMDLMHSFEHMAAIVSELCSSLVASDPSATCNTRLAIELIREVGRLDPSQEAKAMGIKNVAPFVADLAETQPKLFLQHLSHLLPHLQSEPYSIRSSIVTAISHVLQYIAKEQQLETNESENSEENGSLSRLQDVTKTQTTLLDLLAERVYDISSYTRSAALKAWIRLCQTQSVPKERILFVTRLAIDRLQDKAVIVRKQSMQLLTLLLENNPFHGNLNPEPYRLKLEELYEYIKAHLPPDIAEAQRSADSENARELEMATLTAAIAEADLMLSSPDDLSEADEQFCSKVQALKFTESALEFINIFEDATGILKGMLLSANTSDVTEALRFFVQARHFLLPCAVTGMKCALALMWSTEANIREEVLKAFVDVFIAVPRTDGSQLLPIDEIAKNLLVLVGQASVSELASIEEAIIRLVTEERLPDDLFLTLWSIASKSSADTRASALMLISMGARADRTIVDSKSRLKLLLEAGLGEVMQQTTNWRLATAAAICLQRIARAQVDPSDAKYLVLERILDELCKICTGDMCEDTDVNSTLQWFSASEHVIKAIFVISHEPEVACKNIIVDMYNTTMREGIQCVHSLRLARFFHVLGQISLNLLVYTEALSASVRRGNAKCSLKKQEDADKAKKTKGSRNEGTDEEDAIEAELGVAAEVEAENERRLTEIAEKEIVGRNLIGLFGPLLVRVVGNEGGKFNSEILMQSSTLALCKLMCVSSSFCEKHLPLLFTALANAPPEDTTMRANTVIALGDLAFRFPNEVEPYTPRLYGCLRDSSTKVRRHTLMVLTHLILNDMIKVKGQVCEIVMCLRDEDSRIRDMSRLLFHELSKRSNNPIYNLLPEIISQLSQKVVTTEDFRSMMCFLLGYITKERQSDTLIEKLCQRFPNCTTTAQSADLAYCISLLKISERSIKSLTDNFSLYKDALHDEQVMKWFSSIVAKTKKFMKPEKKQLLEDWEAKLNEFAITGAENRLADDKAKKAKTRAKNRVVRTERNDLCETEGILNCCDGDERSAASDRDTGSLPSSAIKKRSARRAKQSATSNASNKENESRTRSARRQAPA